MPSTFSRSTALIMSCFLSVGFDSTGDGQTMKQQAVVRQVAPVTLTAAEQQSETSRWKTLALKLSGNPYLPPKFQPPLTEEQKRKEVATFYRLWSIRSRVLSGTASNEERAFYYKELSQDIRYRVAVLEALKASLGGSAADISRKGHISRTLHYLMRLAAMYSQQGNQISSWRPWRPAATFSPTRSTCYVSTRGIIMCSDCLLYTSDA